VNLKNKKILVTGGNGFLGSFVIKQLEKLSLRVTAPRSNDFNLTKQENCARLFMYDYDLVIHLAGNVGGIGYNLKNPGTLFFDNLVMGVSLMEEARQAGVEKFVTIGTVCSYPKHTPVPFKEEDFWNGYPEETNAPYGLAKKMLLVQSQAYRQQYGFNAIYLVPVNLYGPGDHFEPEKSHVIPALIKKVADAQEKGQNFIEVWGTGNASREFLYVEDAAEAIVLATQHYNKAEPVNVGAGFEVTIRHLIEDICRIMKFEGEIRWDATKPDGQPRRCLDTSRAEKEFGFKAKTPYHEGLKKTILWYLQNR